MVPKLLGLTVFEANEQGATAGSRASSGSDFTYTAPATASAEGQVVDLQGRDRTALQRHHDVIRRPDRAGAVLKKAMKAGIQVITYDSDVPSARDFFIQDTAYSADRPSPDQRCGRAHRAEGGDRHHVVHY